MASALVICVGNTARGDDGVAHRVASLLPTDESVSVLRVHSLDVALAEDVAGVGTVVVVDAERRAGPPVRVERVEPLPPSARTGHWLDAAGLLALAGTLFDTEPECWLVTVAAQEAGHSERLSPLAERAAHLAAAAVSELLPGTSAE